MRILAAGLAAGLVVLPLAAMATPPCPQNQHAEDGACRFDPSSDRPPQAQPSQGQPPHASRGDQLPPGQSSQPPQPTGNERLPDQGEIKPAKTPADVRIGRPVPPGFRDLPHPENFGLDPHGTFSIRDDGIVVKLDPRTLAVASVIGMAVAPSQ